MKKFLLTIALLMSAFTLVACDQIDDIKNTIVMGEGNWDSFTFHNQVVKIIIEEGYGEKVDIVPADTAVLLTGLASEDINIALELWSDNAPTYDQDIIDGKYVEVSTNYDDNAQGLYIPRYLQVEYPDLQSVQDLEDYAYLFPNPEGGDKGIIYGGTQGWKATEFLTKKVELYGLNEFYTFKPIDSTDTLNATLAGAYAKEEPWVGYNWEPTWIIGLYDMVLLEDEEYSTENYEIGRGSFPSVDVTVVVNPSFENDFPLIFEFLQNYQTSSEITSGALAYMQDNSAESYDTAVWFLLQNTDLWESWVTEEAYNNVIEAIE